MTEGEHDTDEHLARLLKTVGRRTEIPESAKRKAEVLFRSQLDQVITRRRRQTRFRYAIAASVLIAVTWLVNFQQQEVSSPRPIAAAVAQQGESVWRSNGVQRNVVEGVQFAVGDVIETHEGLLRVALAAGTVDLRLDQYSQITMLATDKIQLDKGSIYIDAGEGVSGSNAHSTGESWSELVVRTSFGEVTHLGTQYMVTNTASNVFVLLREGAVSVASGGQTFVSRAAGGGEQMIFSQKGLVERRSIAPSDPVWLWVNRIAPDYLTDGKSIAEVMQWLARETGKELVYRGEGTAARAELEVVHGDLPNMSPRNVVAELGKLTEQLRFVENAQQIIVSSGG